MISDQRRNDFTVYCGNNTEFEVSAAFNVDDLEKQEFVLGKGQGTTSFDLKKIGIDAARFVRISCNQNTIELDAIEAKPNRALHLNQ